jgi:ankyrin repeat protein
MIRPSDIREKLSQLPKDLTNIYDEFYNRILMYGTETKTLTIKALKWLMCARDLLSKSVLCEAVSFQTAGEVAELTEDELLEMCQNFISINPRSNFVDFSHTSVREYLGKHFSQSDAHGMASETCLSYMHIRFSNRHDIQPGPIQKDGFHQYCRLYWPSHVLASGNPCLNQSVTKFLQKFMEPHGAQNSPYASWMSEVRLVLAGMDKYASSGSARKWSATLKQALSEDANPIFGAFAFGFTEMAKNLANDIEGELTDLKNEQEFSLMTIACAQGHTELVEFVFNRNPNYFTQPARLAKNFVSAAACGHLGVVKLLFEKRPSIFKDNAGATDTFMIAAALNGHDDVLNFMLENGASSTNEAFHRTPLHVLASRGSTKAVKQLLRRGAKVSAKLPDGMTALHMAATNGHAEVVALLIQGGADVTNKTTDGNTALHLAAGNGRSKIAELLINAGAEILAKNTQGKTALSWAVSNGSILVVETALRNIKRKDDLLDIDITELCEKLVSSPRSGIPIYVSNSSMLPPISSQQGICSANRAAVHAEGRTPLMIGVLNECEEISKLLLARNPESVNLMDNHGLTALHFAAGQGATRLLQCLLDHGADTTIVAESELSAIEFAATEGQAEAVRILLEHNGENALRYPQLKCMMMAWVRAHVMGNPQVKAVISDFSHRFGRRLVWREPEHSLFLETIP